MEREGASRPDYHRLIAKAVADSERLQTESRALVDEVRASARALAATVDAVRRRRTEGGTFGNGHDDARETRHGG
jgi:hypothetical protein